MKVKRLIELLELHDPEAEVVLATQPNYPFEHSIMGVAVREDFDESGDESKSPNDVVLCEGQQLRYGIKDAWDAAER
jgi:hypothetical protein